MGFARVFSFFELEFFFKTSKKTCIVCAYLNTCVSGSFRNVNADACVAMQVKTEYWY